MLKTLDIVIGVSLVMLLVSLVVTVLTQFVTNVANTRGRHLLRGLGDLLQQIDPALERKTARAIAGAVLTHPLISEAMGRYGTVIHREEFTKLLLDFAAGAGAARLGDSARGALKNTLAKQGVANPEAALDNIRSVALQLEVSNPELANNTRQNLAILSEAASPFVARLNGWFDQTIDRVSQRFTYSTRGITFGCGVLVALLLQLDAIALVDRLSVDDGLRNSLTEMAVKLQNSPPPAASTGERAADSAAEVSLELSPENRDAIQALATKGLITVPRTEVEWREEWKPESLGPKLPGIVLSALLLSLGAPFWYNALKNLLRLRSVIATKDDQQRQERQSTQDAGTGGAPAAGSLTVVTGERGNLGALGEQAG
jgi:hypothetical protein